MTSDRDFKHAVRSRAAETGERYTQARAALRPPIAGGAGEAVTAPRFADLQARLESTVLGKSPVVRLVLVALLARGHVLFDDVSGTGRSLLIRTLATAIGATHATIRGSDRTGPDELRADVDLLEIDDLVLTSDGFRAAAVEFMDRDRPMVVANFNPTTFAHRRVEPRYFGDALGDRFLFRVRMGYPDAETELALVRTPDAGQRRSGDDLVLPLSEVSAAADRVAAMTLPESVARRIVEVVHRTRRDMALMLGASPRTARAIARAAAASAVLAGRTEVSEDDLTALWEPVLRHRVWMTEQAVAGGDTPEAVVARVTA